MSKVNDCCWLYFPFVAFVRSFARARFSSKKQKKNAFSVCWKSEEAGTPLSAEKDGKAFSGTVPLPNGKHRFRFVVDGQWRHDPKVRRISTALFTGCSCVVHPPG